MRYLDLFLSLSFGITVSDFDVFNAWTIATRALYLLGLWRIFKKCGIEGWWALIPFVRLIKLAECAGREPEGRMLFVFSVIRAVIAVVEEFIDPFSTLSLFLGVMAIVIYLVNALYYARIYLGLIEVFNQRKPWILLWLFFDYIAAAIWGFGKSYQPLWKVEEIRSAASEYFSGARAQVLGKGLTVNLEERTVNENFHKKYLLRDIHMYIKPGRLVLLLGGSGAGKTTFLNAVNGYEKAKAEIMLNGRNMYREYRDMQFDIGFVPQQDLMRGPDSVFRTLMDAATLRLPRDFTTEQRRARVEEVMQIFGLTPLRNTLVDKMSGGQRKRLSIAMELISNPSLFILDEPDSGLDGAMARELFQQLREIANQGKIVIVITHTPDRVIDMFDDVIVLAKDAKRTGRLAFYGTIQEARDFFERPNMEQIVKVINSEAEGGEGRADDFILRYAEVQHG